MKALRYKLISVLELFLDDATPCLQHDRQGSQSRIPWE